jgi:hypothetical protein
VGSLDAVGRSAVACLAAWGLLTVWALILPPFQVLDEVQHAMRATSVLADPWVTAGDSFVVDQHFTNPMSRAPGQALGKLFFKNYNSLQMSDVPAMKARRWGEDPVVDEVREKWPAASYPPLYHWAVFGIAQPATSLLYLTSYQSTYAYRLASIFWAGVSWSVVYGLLERRLGIAAAVRALGMLLGIPMLAYASSGVNPDALAIPLSAGGHPGRLEPRRDRTRRPARGGSSIGRRPGQALRMLWQTFLRYYAGDAGVLWATLPFN